MTVILYLLLFLSTFITFINGDTSSYFTLEKKNNFFSNGLLSDGFLADWPYYSSYDTISEIILTYQLNSTDSLSHHFLVSKGRYDYSHSFFSDTNLSEDYLLKDASNKYTSLSWKIITNEMIILKDIYSTFLFNGGLLFSDYYINHYSEDGITSSSYSNTDLSFIFDSALRLQIEMPIFNVFFSAPQCFFQVGSTFYKSRSYPYISLGTSLFLIQDIQIEANIGSVPNYLNSGSLISTLGFSISFLL